MLRTFFATVLVMVLGAAGHASAENGLLRVSGSTSVANSIVLPHRTQIESAVGVKLAVSPNSSGAGVTDLLAGNADIAMISSELDEVLAKMAKAVAAYNVDRSELRVFDLGTAKVEFIVNQGNPVKKLSASQLRAIYLGDLKNWQDAGGPAGAIAPFSESRFGAMRTMVEHDLLGGRPFSELVSEVDEAPDVALMVARKPNGIGFISSSTPVALRTGTAVVETDTRIAQRLSLVTRGEPKAEAKRVIEAIGKFRQ
ncbi:MAG: substrate-binding domain-containing protein [Magnetospirillum sp.]|nr:substrate-binding domain-containing protein [Magnetospirillum sp.]